MRRVAPRGPASRYACTRHQADAIATARTGGSGSIAIHQRYGFMTPSSERRLRPPSPAGAVQTLYISLLIARARSGSGHPSCSWQTKSAWVYSGTAMGHQMLCSVMGRETLRG